MHNERTIEVPSVFEGSMNFSDWGDGLTAVTLKELKTTALTLSGTPAYALAIEIKDEELNRVLFENINSYWCKWVNKHSPFHYRYLFLLSFPWLTEWSVLGVARQLYTLQTGKITSKVNAGYYALEVLPHKYRQIIQQSIEIRKSDNKLLYLKPSIKRAEQTIKCLNFIIEKFNRLRTSTGFTTHDNLLARAAYLAMELSAWFVIVPFCLASLFTGLVQALGTKRGLFKHYWIIVKLILTIAATILLLLHMQPISRMAGVAAGTTFANTELPGLRVQLIADAGAALLLLLATTTISVYKPWGKVSLALLRKQEQNAAVQAKGKITKKSGGFYVYEV